jgi:DNA-binding response OmpR family regulator
MLQTHAPSSLHASEHSNGTCRLVIADDSPEMRALVRTAVGNEFAEVVEVADGRELLWTLLRSDFTTAPGRTPELVVITDLCMPAYDGLDVLDAWRDVARDVPTLLMTAYPSVAVHIRAARLGAFVLAKPFAPAALRGVVRAMLRGIRPVGGPR